MPGCKIFVGGLSWETSDEVFTEFFSKFGEIEEAIIMREKATGNSRGFGFVTYVDPSALDQVLSGDLELEGRKVDCKAAVPRDTVTQTGGSNPGRTTKIFVGGLSSDTTTEGLKNYFTRFGGVAEAIVMMDNTTGRSRGFGFVTFESDDSVEKVIAAGDHMINEKGVECKKAMPKTQMDRQRFPGGRQGFGGPGFGGGRGGYGRMGGGRGDFGAYGGGQFARAPFAHPAAASYAAAAQAAAAQASYGYGGQGFGGFGGMDGFGGGGGGGAEYGAGFPAGQEQGYGDSNGYGQGAAYGAAAAYGGQGGGQQAGGGRSAGRNERSFHPYR